uniref:Uncharacterized protein n=1 Tax=Arion vulgaris TaxID=1028688 RepID=A0A0B7AGG9_9EUPU
MTCEEDKQMSYVTLTNKCQLSHMFIGTQICQMSQCPQKQTNVGCHNVSKN